MKTATISATNFKTKCLALLDTVGPEGLTITKHGRAVAILMPVRRTPADLIGALRGQVRPSGNVMSTDEPWHAES